MAYMPLDKASYEDPDVAHHNKAGGFLLDTAELLFEAPLMFSDRGAARIEDQAEPIMPSAASLEPLQSIGALVSQHKEALAKIYSTTAEKIKLIIEA